MDAFSDALIRVLTLAEQRLTYPMHLALHTLDGQEIMALVVPSKGDVPGLADIDELDPDTGQPDSPLLCTIRAWDLTRDQPQGPELRVPIAKSGEDHVDWHISRPSNLIAQLDAENAAHYFAALLVEFDNTFIWILPHDPDRLEMLGDAMRLGGTPLGLMVADYRDGDLTFSRDGYFDTTMGDLMKHMGEFEELVRRHREGRER